MYSDILIFGTSDYLNYQERSESIDHPLPLVAGDHGEEERLASVFSVFSSD